MLSNIDKIRCTICIEEIQNCINTLDRSNDLSSDEDIRKAIQNLDIAITLINKKAGER